MDSEIADIVYEDLHKQFAVETIRLDARSIAYLQRRDTLLNPDYCRAIARIKQWPAKDKNITIQCENIANIHFQLFRLSATRVSNNYGN